MVSPPKAPAVARNRSPLNAGFEVLINCAITELYASVRNAQRPGEDCWASENGSLGRVARPGSRGPQ
jgi:hypothetical protein